MIVSSDWLAWSCLVLSHSLRHQKTRTARPFQRCVMWILVNYRPNWIHFVSLWWWSTWVSACLGQRKTPPRVVSLQSSSLCAVFPVILAHNFVIPGLGVSILEINHKYSQTSKSVEYNENDANPATQRCTMIMRLNEPIENNWNNDHKLSFIRVSEDHFEWAQN